MGDGQQILSIDFFRDPVYNQPLIIMHEDKSGAKRQLGQYGRYLGLGLEFAASILLFIFLGRYLDGKYGTEPWFIVSGAVMGFAVAFYGMYRTLIGLSGKNHSRTRGGG